MFVRNQSGRILPAAVILIASCSQPIKDQPVEKEITPKNILKVAELNTEQIKALDKNKTVVVLPGGILEQHGPYLPSFSDGYMNEAMTDSIARTIASQPGWSVLIFPIIPLGVGGANAIGLKYSFPGTYAVRFETLRTVFMDLATELGEQGFKYIFIIHGHGGPSHNLALEQAADFFNDTYGATMVNLSNLLPTAINFGVDQTEDEAIENGFGIHASMEETSWLLYLQPHLVDKNYRNAVPQSWADTKSLKDSIATQPNWPGYFGSPRLATAGLGKKSYEKISFVYRQLVIDILNQKVEPDTILRYTSVVKNDPGAVEVTRLLQEEENRRKQKQMEWLKKKELQ